MPFPRTWSEELIAEWLQLDGFLTQTNLPVAVAVSNVGGRLEADVVGARIRARLLEVRHIETGMLVGGVKSAARIQSKFSDRVTSAVIDYFRCALSFEGPKGTYEKLYVATVSSAPVKSELGRQGVEVISMGDFICSRVLPTVNTWKNKPPWKSRSRRATLPQSLWLLQMLDYLNAKGMLRE